MKKNNDYLIISIESRKGGVGKTSVAMNLARLLLTTNKFEVIFLDLDMSGTEASKFVPSLQKQNVWKDRIHIVKKPIEDNKSPGLNIVEIFENFMTGEEIPSVNWSLKHDSNRKNELVLQSGRINIFSSFIKRTNQYFNEPGHFYGPAALFDEIHSAWFISMIKDLLKKCSKTQPSGKRLVVIIDNAPGYSGLEPAIEDWLTDLGPEHSKFLFVCSIDTQDLFACFNSLKEIEHIYLTKWEASRKFLSMAIDKTEGTIEDTHKNFFNRLAETYTNCQGEQSESPKCIDCGFCYYRSLSTDIGEKFKKSPQFTLAIIMNKVPENVYKEKYKIKIGDLLAEMKITVDENLTLDKLEEYYQNNEIQFPEIVQVLIFLQANQIPFKTEWSLQYCIDRLFHEEKILPTTTGKELKKIKLIINNLQQNRLPNVPPFSISEKVVIESKINLIEKFCSVETHMNGSSHPKHENCVK